VISGTVTEDGVPIVLLSLGGRTWDAVIDSGFNGDIELPEQLGRLLEPRFLYRIHSLLASGQEVDEDLYSVQLPFDGQNVTAEATFVSGTSILVGTHLLQSYRLEINFVARTVLLERVAQS
jgi:predicted aspartyl protease